MGTVEVMPIPPEVIAYADDFENQNSMLSAYSGKGQVYIETAEIFKDKLYVRLWAVRIKKDKHGKHLFKEVFRETEDTKWSSGSMLFCYMGGYTVVWENHKSGYGYYTYEVHDELEEVEEKPGVQIAKRLWDMSIVYHDPTLKYCGINESVVDLLAYIRAYRKYPQLEMISKSGFNYLARYSRFLKKHGPAKKEMMRWLADNKEKVLSEEPTYNTICKCIREKITFQDYLDQMYKEEIREGLGKIDPIAAKEIFKYLRKQEQLHPDYPKQLSIYRDWLIMAKKNHLPTKTRGVMFPHDLIHSHDGLKSNIEKEKIVKINKNLDALSKQLGKTSWISQGLKFYIPSSFSEVQAQATNLSQCLITGDYVGKMAKGHCILVFISKDDKPLETAEISMIDKPALVQLHGNHNHASEYHQTITKALETTIVGYIRKAKENIKLEDLSLVNGSKATMVPADA